MLEQIRPDDDATLFAFRTVVTCDVHHIRVRLSLPAAILLDDRWNIVRAYWYSLCVAESALRRRQYTKQDFVRLANSLCVLECMHNCDLERVKCTAKADPHVSGLKFSCSHGVCGYLWAWVVRVSSLRQVRLTTALYLAVSRECVHEEPVLGPIKDQCASPTSLCN